jgi:alkylation response protein AidB-like acyl-CoA dehydrogenase
MTCIFEPSRELPLTRKRFWSSQILGTPLQARRWLREFTEGNYYLGGAVNPRNADMIARDEGDSLVFNGDKFFSTGTFSSSDRYFRC